ncbi:KinB sensor domain-containing domain, partial [Pseudomonas poae]|uniref:KinB sensor domain-containing domain n=2 Tax=Pseudomonas TaxID=286 RepID=UPI002882DEC2
MKLAMKLRTRLFLSISALITVALLGLILGLVSVMQMAKTQESLLRSSFITLDLGLKLRQSLGDQLIMMLENPRDSEALQASKQRYFELLDQGIAHEQQNGSGNGFSQARIDYQNLLQAFDKYQQPSPPPGSKEQLTETFNVLRNGLIVDHKQALENISTSEHKSRERALVISGLLGLVGLAVLIIGFVTAHG